MDWLEACSILGVKETATPEEIKAQYFYKANILHPDKTLHLSDAMRTKAEQELKLINQVHDFLVIPGNNPFRNPPKLDIKPKHIRFKDVEVGQKKSTVFEICSIGGPYTNVWIDNEPAEWLSIVSVKSMTSEQLPLEVTIEADGVGEPDKKYSCDLLVRLENEKTKLKNEEKVRVELWTIAEPALLRAHPNTFEVDSIPTGEREERTFTLSNPGRGPLKGTIATYKPWLSIKPAIISIPPSGQQQYVVTVDATLLPSGFKDKDSIDLSTNAGNYGMPFTISVITADVDEPPEPQAQQPARELVQGVGFSFKEFWHMLWMFFIMPIGAFWITIPVGIWLFGVSEPGFWTLLGTYGVVALVVAIVRGDSKGRKESLAHRQQINATTSTKPRDIFAPSVKTTSSNLVIGNTFRSVYHRDSCKWAAQMSRGNKVKITRDEAIRRGYKRCSVCRP